jgi:hypothetical protein
MNGPVGVYLVLAASPKPGKRGAHGATRTDQIREAGRERWSH